MITMGDKMKIIDKSKFSDYNDVAARFGCGPVFPLSVTQGYQPGKLILLESCLLIRHYCEFGYLSAVPSQEDGERIFELMKDAAKNGGKLILFAENEAVTKAFSQFGVCVEDRIFYEFAQEKANVTQLPDGFELTEINTQLLEKISGRIVPAFAWDSSESFLAKGKGFCVVHNEMPAAWAFSSAVCDSMIDIGIETCEGFKGKGLATAVAGKMAEYVLSIGKKPTWACHGGNAASQKTAERTGFKKVSQCKTIRYGA